MFGNRSPVEVDFGLAFDAEEQFSNLPLRVAVDLEHYSSGKILPDFSI